MFRNILKRLFASGSPGEGGEVPHDEESPGQVQAESEQAFENTVADEAAHDP